jgi:hypothetical protein
MPFRSKVPIQFVSLMYETVGLQESEDRWIASLNEMVSLILQEKGTQLEGSEICAIATMCVLSPLKD